MVRSVQARSRYTNIHDKIVTLQRSSRMVMEKNRFTKKRHSAIRLSAWMRGNSATQKVQGMRRERAATKIQSHYRSIAAIQRAETARKDWIEPQPKLKSILRNKSHNRSSMSEASTTKYPSSVGSATEMPTMPSKSGFMYCLERSLDCLICDCPGSSPAAVAVAE
jgi:hypothetical protein